MLFLFLLTSILCVLIIDTSEVSNSKSVISQGGGLPVVQ